MHIIFDAPNPNHICTHRDRSNTPLQALTLLNDPVFYEAAKALARRVRQEVDADDQQRMVQVFRWCLARDPNPEELDVLKDLFEQVRRDQKSTGQATATDAVEDPAWIVLCSVLFNLHEFVTRN